MVWGIYNLSFIIISVVTLIFVNKLTKIKKSSINLNYIILMGIIAPIFEESIFRGTLVNLTSDYKYYKEFNYILFGLYHSANYIVHKNGLAVIIQVLSTTCLGYYVINLDNILYSMLAHIIHNLIIIVYIKNYCADDTVEMFGLRSGITDHLHKPKLRKSYSLNDLFVNNGDCIYTVRLERKWLDDKFLDNCYNFEKFCQNQELKNRKKKFDEEQKKFKKFYKQDSEKIKLD